MRNEPANPEAQVIEMPFPGRHKVPPWGTDTLTSLSTQNYADLKSFLVKRRRCDQSRVMWCSRTSVTSFPPAATPG